MENKKQRTIISVMQKGFHCSIAVTEAELEEMTHILKEGHSWDNRGLDLWKEAQRRLQEREAASEER